MIKKWETIQRQPGEDYRIFRAEWIKRKHPDWNKTGNFVVLNSPRWVNIIPITKDNEVVLIEQYRHGIDDITLEVPGGLVEQNEMPQVAAERECLEETGFRGSGSAQLLAEILPNPAFMTNKCWSFVWFDCEQADEQHLDGNEDIRVLTVPMNEIKKLIENNKINHSLVLNAFFFYFLKYGV